jgi:hypothetical protein
MLSIIPAWLATAFVLVTLATLILLLRAFPQQVRRKGAFLLTAWLAVQAAVAASGFYTFTNSVPPRFALAVAPPTVFIILLMLLPAGRRLIASVSPQRITWMQTVRAAVELCLLALFLCGAVPKLLTFEGINYDIITGITAPFVAIFAYRSRQRGWIIAWNLLCLFFLFNVVFHGVLSVPTPLQRYGFEQPNIGMLYFPFAWLPAFVVPAALFGHVVALFHAFAKQVPEAKISKRKAALQDA